MAASKIEEIDGKKIYRGKTLEVYAWLVWLAILIGIGVSSC